jgi:hypothetical protein
MSDAGRAAGGPAGTGSSLSLDERAELERLRAEAAAPTTGRPGPGLGLTGAGPPAQPATAAHP